MLSGMRGMYRHTDGKVISKASLHFFRTRKVGQNVKYNSAFVDDWIIAQENRDDLQKTRFQMNNVCNECDFNVSTAKPKLHFSRESTHFLPR
jgi:hypothetical protein